MELLLKGICSAMCQEAQTFFGGVRKVVNTVRFLEGAQVGERLLSTN